MATEALSCVVNYLFKKPNKHRVDASIDPENIKSMELVKRLGFRKESHFKESILINGKWCNNPVYAILKKMERILNLSYNLQNTRKH